MFESCVVLDGSQTNTITFSSEGGFESCVVLDGSQTKHADYAYRV